MFLAQKFTKLEQYEDIGNLWKFSVVEDLLIFLHGAQFKFSSSKYCPWIAIFALKKGPMAIDKRVLV